MPFTADQGDLIEVPAPAPPPAAPPAQAPAPAPSFAPMPVPAPVPAGPSGSVDEGARGLPQQGAGPVGPIVAPHPPPIPPAATPPAGPAARPEPAGPVDVPPDHRGLPQPGDKPGETGPIVEPHPPGPGDGGGSGRTGGDGTGGGKTLSPGGGGGEATRTVLDAFTVSAPPGDNRAQTAYAWLHLQQFFSGAIPHAAVKLKAARAMLPKGVG